MLQLLLKRGTTAQNNAYTGELGELTIDSELNCLRLHDGTTAGGKPIYPGVRQTGTFTPVFTGSSAGEMSAGATKVGTYIRDDNLVTCFFTINNNFNSVAIAYAGDITIEDLPFTAAGNSNNIYPMQIAGFRHISGIKAGYVAGGTNRIKMTVLTNTTSGGEANMTASNLGSEPGIWGSVTYPI